MIPTVILPYVFQQLTEKELLTCSLVCKLWYTLTFDPLLSRHWKTINFQEKVDQLTEKYVRHGVTVKARLKTEEGMNWEHIFNTVLKRGKMHIQYLKMWSSFGATERELLLQDQGFLNHLMILDLRGSQFDFSILFEPYPTSEKKKVLLIKGKEKVEDKSKDEKNENNLNEKEENKSIINNDNEKCCDKNNKTVDKETSIKNQSNGNSFEITTKSLSSTSPSSESSLKSSTSIIASSSSSSPSSSQYFLDYFHHLHYLYIYGCPKITLPLLEKFHQHWPTIQLDVKECPECHQLTRIGANTDKKLNSDPSVIKKLSHCSVCHKEHCDHCRPLWTCEVCGGDPTCRDCRAHGLKCTTCDGDFCYTCQQPKKVLQCRYCHRMSCGQSRICQNLGYLYKACDRCDYYVCQTCREEPMEKGEEKKLVVCSGPQCHKSYCKTCIHESAHNALISFDREAVEKRVQEYNFALCSYCNKLYCNDCIGQISFYIGSKDLPYCIILCKECETFYKTQLMPLFKAPPLNPASTSNPSSHSNRSDERHNNNLSLISTSSPPLYTDNVITNTPLDSPIDVLSYYDYDQYIR